MDDEHVLALVEAVDRADLHAIHVFALYAVFVDDVGHGRSRQSVRYSGRSIGRPSVAIDGKRVARRKCGAADLLTPARSRSISRQSRLLGRRCRRPWRHGSAHTYSHRASASGSARSDAKALVLKSGLGLARRTAPGASRHHPDDLHSPMEGYGQNVAGPRSRGSALTIAALVHANLAAATLGRPRSAIFSRRANHSHLSRRWTCAVGSRLLRCIAAVSPGLASPWQLEWPRAAKGESGSIAALRAGAAECMSGRGRSCGAVGGGERSAFAVLRLAIRPFACACAAAAGHRCFWRSRRTVRSPWATRHRSRPRSMRRGRSWPRSPQPARRSLAASRLPLARGWLSNRRHLGSFRQCSGTFDRRVRLRRRSLAQGQAAPPVLRQWPRLGAARPVPPVASAACAVIGASASAEAARMTRRPLATLRFCMRKPEAPAAHCPNSPAGAAEHATSSRASAREAAVAGRALGRRTRLCRGARPPGHQRPDHDRRAAPACRCAPRAVRTCGSRRRDKRPPARPGRRAARSGPGAAARAGLSTSSPARLPFFKTHKQQRQLGRGRLQQRREVDVEGAEAHAVLAQLSARRLVERAISSATASRRRTPKLSPRRKAMPRASPAMSLASAISTSGFSRSPIELGEPGVEPLLHLLLVGAGQVLVGDDGDARLERIVAGLAAARSPRRATGSGRGASA